MSKTKPNRVYHKAWDKYGDILAASGNWITCRFDGEKGTNCYEVDAPYIEVFILEENLKAEPLPENPLAELHKDKERLEWLMSMVGWASTRQDIDRMRGEDDEHS